MAFNIEVVPNQAGKPAILLRQAWREGKRVRKKTIANLSKLPPQVIEGFRTVLKGGVAVSDVSELLEIEHSFDHGNTIAVLGTARKRALARLLHRSPSASAPWRSPPSSPVSSHRNRSSPPHGGCPPRPPAAVSGSSWGLAG